MALPALIALRRAYPRAMLAVCARRPLEELFLAARDPADPGIPLVKDALVLTRKRGAGRLVELIRDARRIRRRLVPSRRGWLGVVLPNSFESALHMRLVGPPRRLGYASDGRSMLLRPAVRRPSPSLRQHHSDYYLGLLRGAGIPAEQTMPCLHCPEEGRREAALLLAACGVTERGSEAGAIESHPPLIAIHAGAAFGLAKRWPPSRYIEFALRAVADLDAQVVLVGSGTDEVELARTIAESAGSSVHTLAGATTMAGLIGVLARADAVVGNDSGPLHVAAALGTPTVTIFGPTNPYRTAPMGDRGRFLYEAVECSPCELAQCPIDHHCMTRIDVDQVIAAVVAVLSSRRSSLSSPAAL